MVLFFYIALLGNYVFMDRTQLSKGIITYNDIALFVLVTVVSSNNSFFFVDAGSKVLSSDLAPHGAEGITGYRYYKLLYFIK